MFGCMVLCVQCCPAWQLVIIVAVCHLAYMENKNIIIIIVTHLT